MFKARLLNTQFRSFSTSIKLANKQSKAKIDSHLEYLSKFYSPELLQSIKITESLVEPDALLKLSKQGINAKSANPPKESIDFTKNDPKWDEPILYPNQPNKQAPYPAIPQIQAADRTDLKLRFKPTEEKRVNPLKTHAQIAEGLAKLTGLDESYIKRLQIRPIVMKRVSCQTSKGKIPNFYALTVVGDKNGMVGLGEGKSRDGMRTALIKAHWNAVKNLKPVKRYENRTIVGDISLKYHAVKLFIKSAPQGFGLRVNSNIFEICQVAGIEDLRGKVYKSRNPMNVVKAFYHAITNQTSLEDIAAGRGKKLVDLRKVYYSA
ncbi:37S ribosomal protein S5, mitochondrial [[Candida] jaroonii]|uniref:37S ribosomal protein S5, mitochondrial n=1 Tax=[Candida] jaroonii TaxID=467808 RepID=A0ACA9Y0T7_9ASCO|nr:37S ribosomal protein S5, mitochondrial [[Candida] jaroonii]